VRRVRCRRRCLGVGDPDDLGHRVAHRGVLGDGGVMPVLARQVEALTGNRAEHQPHCARRRESGVFLLDDSDAQVGSALSR